jgi:outer membrane protein OmpA-like peptidoglycan-associated protein
MQRLSIVLLMTATLVATSGCATKKFVRTSVKTSSDTLTARIETNESDLKETRDTFDKKVNTVDTKVTAVDGKVSALDSKTTEGLNSVRTDVKNVDQRAQTAAGNAQSAAEKANSAVGSLDSKFQNRNQFDVSSEKTIQFKFDSAKLDKEYTDALDEIAATLNRNVDAIVVLEGHTDSTGNKDYNVRLGERRIEAVRRYLAVDKGVAVYKIHDISFGQEKPIAENKTKDGREKNRAVTMTIMVPKLEGSVASRNNN